MSDDTARFRVRTAKFEVEYEGPATETSSRYDAMIARLQSEHLPSFDVINESNDGHLVPEKQKTKRGGIRSSVISKAVDQLTTEGWFKARRTVELLLQEMQNRRVPGVDRNNLSVALNRRVRSGKLQSIKDHDVWVFWSEE